MCKITIHPLFWFCEKQIWDFLISLSSLCSYRYTLDDLFPMMTAVRKRAELYDDWASLVMETLEAKLEKKKGKCKKKKKTFCKYNLSDLMIIYLLFRSAGVPHPSCSIRVQDVP